MRRRLFRIAPCVALFAASAFPQVKLSLEQAGSRTGPDFAPAYEGKEVIVKGQVSANPQWAVDAYYVPIQDEHAYGLLLQGAEQQFAKLTTGEWVEVQGVISKRAGVPVLVPTLIQPLTTQAPPSPKELKVGDIAAFRYLGVLVTTESEVAAIGENGGGQVVSIGEKGKFVNIFLPKARRLSSLGLGGLNTGDRVRVTGIATQYCPLPPYDGSFQVLVSGPSAVKLVAKNSIVPPLMVLGAFVAIGLLLGIWWLRERRLARQRRILRTLNSLGEEIVAAGSPSEILQKLDAVIPRVSGATGVRLYTYSKRTKTLDQTPGPSDPEPISVAVDAPIGGLAAAACVCFRNRTLLNIPDTRRSPFIGKAARTAGMVRSVLFVPMFAQNELLGVLELDHTGNMRYFTREEQAATQHLANQVATSLKLQEQQSMREQLFRSEKLAATGQLISGVANELRAPLESIRKLSRALIARNSDGPQERDLRVLSAECQRASDIVARLISFGQASSTQAKLVEVNGVLAGLIQFRQREWETLGLTLENRLARDPLHVLGAQGQIEEVFLNLLVHAEQSVAEAPEKIITVSSSTLANRVLIEIGYSTPPSDSLDPDPFDAGAHVGAMGLEVCRGFLQSHGGEIRYLRLNAARCQFQVELPVARDRNRAAPLRGSVRKSQRQMTILLVEPDAAVQRQLVDLLGSRGHRVVPIGSAEEGAEMAHRLRFDLVFCSVRLPGLNWVEFFERIRPLAGAFVLTTDGFDSNLSHAFHPGEGYVLPKPIQESEVERLLEAVDARMENTPLTKAVR